MLMIAGNFLFSQSSGVFYHDSVMAYYFDTSGDSLLEGKIIYNRDSVEQATETIYYGFDQENKTWHPSDSVVQAFDEYGNQVLYEHYHWDTVSEAWRGTDTRLEYLFDADGHKLMQATYRWDTTDNQWAGISKSEYVVSPDGKDVHISYHYTWEPKHAVWLNHLKWNYEYNQQEELEGVTGSEWDVEDDRWVQNYQKKLGYDSDGRLVSTSSLVLDEDQNEWINYQKEEYKYDADGTERYVLYTWDKNHEVWENKIMSDRKWDGDGHLVYLEEYEWYGDKWHGFTKIEKKYDNGFLMVSVYYNWDETGEKWIYGGQNSYERDENGRTLLYVFQKWDADADEWVNVHKDEYVWSEEGWLLLKTYSRWNDDENTWRCSSRTETEYNKCGREHIVKRYSWSNETGSCRLSEKKFYYYQGFLYDEHASVCPGDSVPWQGIYLKDEGVHTRRFSSVTCRDSVYRMTLSFYDRPDPFAITGADTVETNELSLYSTPENDQVTYTWTVEGGNIIAHPSGNSLQVQWGDPGEGRLYAVASNQQGCYSDTAALKIVINSATDVVDAEGDRIILYPNPVRDHIDILAPGRIVRTEVYDLSGKILLETEAKNIDVSGLDDGVYIVNIKDQNGKVLKTVRIIKR